MIKDFPAGVPSPPAVLEGVEGDQAFNLDNFSTTLRQLWNNFGATLVQLFFYNFETILRQSAPPVLEGVEAFNLASLVRRLSN